MIFKNEDEKIKKRSKIDDADTFWDVEDITPPGSKAVRSGFAGETELTLIMQSLKNETAKGEPIKPQAEYGDIVSEYKPDNPFITKITVSRWNKNYAFYARFRQDARRYFTKEGTAVPPVRYFSYMPGYAQMSKSQRDWYFYWRSCVRKGKYLPADSSYVLLYVYEIINLNELISPEKGIELLCDIWERYRGEYTKLDRYMTEWVCDYCLVYGLPFPKGRLSSFFDKIKETASLRQFYLEGTPDEVYAILLMDSLSDYKLQKSKYITEENKDIFYEHVTKGFAYAIKKFALSDGRFEENGDRLIIRKRIRDAFSGALCTYEAKRRIDIECYDLGNVGDIGFIVTDAVKYCENRVRAALGIRAKLVTQNITEQQKSIIDEYFDRVLPRKNADEQKKKKDTDYDLPVEVKREFSVSYEKAKEIEKNSWATTERLVDTEEYEEDYFEEQVFEEPNSEEKKSEEGQTLDVAKEGLRLIAAGDIQGFSNLADECYMLPDTLAECVNELCYEVLGDIGIEEKNGEYALIDDYREEIMQWLNY